MYQYYGTAVSNFQKYLKDNKVSYKKYFYVIRPLLACQWIEERNCPPPVLFSKLVESVLEEKMKVSINRLLEEKIRMKESDKGEKIQAINDYIEEKLIYYKEKISNMKDDRNSDWNELNKVFLKNI